MPRKYVDLAAAVAAAVAAAGLVLAKAASGGFLSIFGILLVAALPGYVFSWRLLPELKGEERLLVSLGLSLAIDGVSGLLMNFMPWGLTAQAWAIWLGELTLIGAALEWHRRAKLIQPGPFRWPRISLTHGLLYGLAAVLVFLAMQISTVSYRQLNAPLTMLWANQDPAQPRQLIIGVQNEEGKPMTYELAVLAGGDKLRVWRQIELSNGEVFTGQITFQSSTPPPAEVLLYRMDQPGSIYRQVRIVFNGGSEVTLRK